MRMEEKHICPQKGENHLYKIGMFAQMNHVTVRTLHFYEEHKLLLPAWIDAENGYRYYTMDQMAVLHQIMALKQAGFTIEDIKRLQETTDTSAYLRRKKTELLNKIAELTRQISVLDGYMAGRGSTIERPVLIKTIPAAIVASTQARIESYDVLFELMPRLGAEMERLGCRCALPEYCFTRGRFDLDAKLQITRKLAREYADWLIPLDGIFASACIQVPGTFWSADGVHPTAAGAQKIALHYADAFDALYPNLGR